MRRIGWKVCTVGAIGLDCLNFMTTSPHDPIRVLPGIPTLVGLVGYAWSLTIGPRWFWRLVFLFESLTLFAAGAAFLPIVWRQRSTWPDFFIGALVLGTGMSVVELYGLYLYGFGSAGPSTALQPGAAAV